VRHDIHIYERGSRFHVLAHDNSFRDFSQSLSIFSTKDERDRESSVAAFSNACFTLTAILALMAAVLLIIVA